LAFRYDESRRSAIGIADRSQDCSRNFKKKNMFTCRECENEINQATELCPHCGADLTAPIPGSSAEKAKPRLGKILLRWGVLLGVLLGAIWSFLWFVVPERQGDPTAQAEARAADSLREVRSSLVAFASAQGGAYPQRFEAVGERVRIAAQVAQSVNYQIQYTPGPVDPNGTIRSFALQARAGNYGFRNFYLDDSGILRATKESRAATSEDPPY
jgi:hypothetical protein